MFKSGMLESKNSVIPIEETNEVCFKEMLKFIYCGQSDSSVLQENAVDMLAIADRVRVIFGQKYFSYFNILYSLICQV